MSGKWVVRVDSAICAGHALCEARAPEVYAVSDEGFSIADGTLVTEATREAAERGARVCPEQAIRLEPLDN